MKDINDIPKQIRCEQCGGFGVTEDPETIIGEGWLLEAGKAYLNRNEQICSRCMGRGIDPDKLWIENGVAHYHPSQEKE